jgi:excisionase family DNA binding protein
VGLNKEKKVEKKFITVAELAEYLGYNKQTVYNLVNQEKVPYLKPNGKLLFDVEAIDNWVRSSGKGGDDEMV